MSATSSLLLTIGFLALATLAPAGEDLLLRGQSEIWGDSSMTHTIAKSMGSPAGDEKVVRAQLAGTHDSFVQSGLLFYPEDMCLGKYQGFPAAFFSGLSFANHKRRKCSITVIFSKSHTYTVHCFSPIDSELPDPQTYLHIEGEPSEVTETAFQFLEPRIKERLPKMREIARQVIKAAGESVD